MSEAVEGAELMLYGVSEKYKESANCRLELNYGMQEAKAMVPLMMQQGFKAKGWLGLILGTRMYLPTPSNLTLPMNPTHLLRLNLNL